MVGVTVVKLPIRTTSSKPYDRGEHGVAFVLVMVLIPVVLIYGGALLQGVLHDARSVDLEQKRLKAYYLARSGAVAVLQWAQSNSVTDLLGQQSAPVSLGEGAFSVEVIEDADGSIIIKSTGTVDGVSQVVKVRPQPQEVAFDSALFSSGDITLKGSAGITGQVMTNSSEPGSISISGSGGIRIDGNVYIGPQGNPLEVVVGSNNLNPFAVVSGEISNLQEARNYPTPLLPDFPNLPQVRDGGPISGGVLKVEGGKYKTYTLTEGGYFQSIEVKGNGALYINVGSADMQIRTRNLDISQGHIIVQGSGNLQIYVEDSFSIGGSSTVNAGGSLDDVTVFHRGSETIDIGGAVVFKGSLVSESANVELGGSGAVTGHLITGGSQVSVQGSADAETRLLYAPNADISVKGSGYIRGAVIGRTIDVSGSAHVTFVDVDLDSIPVNLSGAGGSAGASKPMWL